MRVSTTKDYLQAGIELDFGDLKRRAFQVKDLRHEQVTRVEYLN